jgi:NAD(P)-dependent dehydrogenase (short-subunit alcohol dehydrogenase family)
MFGKTNSSIQYARIAASSIDLAGKRVAVVGGTDGLGRAIARLAAARGADVIVVGRTFRDEGVPRISFIKADLSLTSAAKKVGGT